MIRNVLTLVAISSFALPAVSVADDSVVTTESHGIVPIPDYNGSISERRHLSGDWSGTRSNLAKRGLQLDLSVSQFEQAVLDGGREQEAVYGVKIDSAISMDLDRMGILPGALVSTRIESRFGESVNHASGALLPVNDPLYFPLTSKTDDPVPPAITELRYTQFLSQSVGVFAGKFITLGADANEFAGGRGDTQFQSHPFLSASVTALVNPYSTLGAGALWKANQKTLITSSLYSTTDSSTSSGFDSLDDGWLSSTVIRTQYDAFNLPGGMQLTGQYAFNSNYVDFRGSFITPEGGVRLPRTSDSWNVFWNGWQYLYVESAKNAKTIDVTDGRADLEGVGVFMRAGTADKDTNPVEWVVSGGLGGRGMIPGRSDDSFGIGYAYTRLQTEPFVTDLFLNNQARRLEAYYSFAIVPSVELAIDLQWVDAINARIDPAFLLGGRLRVAL